MIVYLGIKGEKYNVQTNKRIKYLADNSNYSLEARATFGLPISYDEVKGISKMLKLDK